MTRIELIESKIKENSILTRRLQDEAIEQILSGNIDEQLLGRLEQLKQVGALLHRAYLLEQ